jgi:hypothetical protein
MTNDEGENVMTNQIELNTMNATKFDDYGDAISPIFDRNGVEILTADEYNMLFSENWEEYVKNSDQSFDDVEAKMLSSMPDKLRKTANIAARTLYCFLIYHGIRTEIPDYEYKHIKYLTDPHLSACDRMPIIL